MGIILNPIPQTFQNSPFLDDIILSDFSILAGQPNICMCTSGVSIDLRIIRNTHDNSRAHHFFLPSSEPIKLHSWKTQRMSVVYQVQKTVLFQRLIKKTFKCPFALRSAKYISPHPITLHTLVGNLHSAKYTHLL